MKNVLLVGAGQLGSRYLQSIIKERLNCNIIVVDINKNSIKTCKNIWIKMEDLHHHTKLTGYQIYLTILNLMI